MENTTQMNPEKGNPTVTVTREDITQALADVGVMPGDTVMFHSSLSSMGTVLGGATAVIEGFLAAAGPSGTVAVPTLWWHPTHPPLRIEDWDIASSPSYVGFITEVFRKRPDSIRSDNPTHSVSAIGRRAAELTADHGAYGPRPCPWGKRAFAACSPWQKLVDWDATYCFVGVDLRVATLRHLVEAVYLQRVLDRIDPAQRDELESRINGDWGQNGIWTSISGDDVDQRITEAGLLRFGRIGSATLRYVRARSMADRLLAMLENDPPERWFKPVFVRWLQDAKAAGRGDTTDTAREPMPS